MPRYILGEAKQRSSVCENEVKKICANAVMKVEVSVAQGYVALFKGVYTGFASRGDPSRLGTAG